LRLEKRFKLSRRFHHHKLGLRESLVDQGIEAVWKLQHPYRRSWWSLSCLRNIAPRSAKQTMTLHSGVSGVDILFRSAEARAMIVKRYGAVCRQKIAQRHALSA
jgi:hypothetical protein